MGERLIIFKQQTAYELLSRLVSSKMCIIARSTRVHGDALRDAWGMRRESRGMHGEFTHMHAECTGMEKGQ